MLTYQNHDFAATGRDILSTLREHPQQLRQCLDGWLASRKGDVDLASLRILEQEGSDQGTITLAFQETQWLACQLETGRQPHQVRIPFRFENGKLILSTLPRDAFGERHDEI